MIEQTQVEWLVELRRLADEHYGGDIMLVVFECPSCGNRQTMADFKLLGFDPQLVYTNCIGRLRGKLPPVDGPGCAWASFGLLGTLGKGRLVTQNDAKPIEVFDFADPLPLVEETSDPSQLPTASEWLGAGAPLREV